MENLLSECFHSEKIENNEQQTINLLVKNGEEIRCIKSKSSLLNTINKDLYSIYASLASTNPMAVAANYPDFSK